jgi:hypothetical protein
LIFHPIPLPLALHWRRLRLGFDGGLGGETEEMSLLDPAMRQSLLSRKSRVGVCSIG